MPSLNHSQVIPPPSLPFVSSPVGQWASFSPTMCISLPKTLLSAIQAVCKSSIRGPSHAHGLVVADTGTTDHMLPDASAFISYKQVMDVSICMGNNSFALVLGWGTAVFSLNGKQVLVRNTLHVPGLAVPLYSLRAHLHQRGCGFIGTFEDGFHIYFPSSILSVDMSSDCHLTYKPLGSQCSITFNRGVLPTFIFQKLWLLSPRLLHTLCSSRMRMPYWLLTCLEVLNRTPILLVIRRHPLLGRLLHLRLPSRL
jgi:hypothetical protein